MCRWTLRLCLVSLTVGACFFGCADSATSDSDGGADVARGGGGGGGAGGVTGAGGLQQVGGAFALGGSTSTGQQSTSRIQSNDAGFPDHPTLVDPFPRPDAGTLPGGVPSCEASVQRGVSCTAGPTSACVPTSAGTVCLCPTGTWVCF
jgi:hypothetical protein